jgi:hypothetical protein
MGTRSLMDRYNFKSIDKQIKTIEAAAKEIKRLSGGMKAIDINANSILAFTYILSQNVSDVIDLESEEVQI